MTRHVLLVTLVVTLGGCATWRPVSESPREFVSGSRPGWLRVEYANGRSHDLRAPVLRGDSIVEQGRLCANGQCVDRRTVVPLDGIMMLFVRRTSIVRTGAFVVFGSFGALALAFILSGGV